MPYAIIRHEKIKTIGNLTASSEHTFRERPTNNADASRTHLNEHEGANSAAEIVQRFEDEFPKKMRKNGVIAIEYLMTASPEWWEKASAEQQAEFFKRSREFLYERHGKENVLYTGTQLDESTPHMVAYVLPRDDKGRMNAAHFLDGRKKLSECQDTYAEKVKNLGLERGIEGSTAKHERVKRHYGLLKMADKREPELSTKDKLSITIGIPTKTALEALEVRSAVAERGLFMTARKNRLEARERGLDARESAVASDSAQLDERAKAIKVREGELVRQGREIFLEKQEMQNLRDRVPQLEKQLKDKSNEQAKSNATTQAKNQQEMQALRETHRQEIQALKDNQERNFREKLKEFIRPDVEAMEAKTKQIAALEKQVTQLTADKSNALDRAKTAETKLNKLQDKGHERG